MICLLRTKKEGYPELVEVALDVIYPLGITTYSEMTASRDLLLVTA